MVKNTPTACRPLTPEEAKSMMATFTGKFKNRNRALMALGICTGFRISELLALRVEDVYYFGNISETIRLPKRLLKGKRSRKPKTIFPEAKELLLLWINEMKETMNATKRSYLFTSAKGGSLGRTACYCIMIKAAKDAGMSPEGIGTHSLRKTFANTVYDYWNKRAREGERLEPMRIVQLELGHSSIEDTYSYMEFKLEEKPDDVFSKYNFLGSDLNDEKVDELQE